MWYKNNGTKCLDVAHPITCGKRLDTIIAK